MKKDTPQHEALMAALSQVLQRRREELRLSQEEVAARAGLHRTYISDIERGTRNLSVRNLSRLAEALEIAVSRLVHEAESVTTALTAVTAGGSG